MAVNIGAGDQQFVQWAFQYTLSVTRGYSVGGWINASSNPASYATFIAKGNGGGTSRTFWVGLNSTTFNFAAYNDVTASHGSQSTVAAVVPGDWYYVLAVFLGSVVVLYVFHYPAAGGPGALLTNNAGTTGAADADDANNFTNVGRNPAGGLTFNGSVYNWIVWDCALTAIEARAIGSGAINPLTIRPRSQAVRLAFDQALLHDTLSAMEMNRGWSGAHYYAFQQFSTMFNVPNPPATGPSQQWAGLGYRSIQEYNNPLGGAGLGRLGSPMGPFPTMIAPPPTPGFPHSSSRIIG